jgi:hypothetical protein
MNQGLQDQRLIANKDRDFLFAIVFRSVLEMRRSFPGMRRPESEVGQSVPFRAEVKNALLLNLHFTLSLHSVIHS